MLTLLLMSQAPSAEAVMNRLEQFLKRTDTLSVVIKGKVNGRSFGAGSFKMDKPARMNLSTNLNGSVMSFILNENGGLEIDRANQIYADHPTIGRLFLPPFKLNRVLSFVAPSILIRSTTRDMFPANAKPSLTRNVVVAGVTTDLITAKAKTDMGGEVEVKAWIDGSGRPVKYYSRVVTPQTSMTIEHEYSGYSVNKKIADSAFSTTLPLGFSPWELPRADYGLQQGAPVPNVDLRSAGSGSRAKLSELTSGANTLVLVADPDFPANAALLKSIRNVSMRIPDFRLVVLSTRRDPSSAKRIGVSDAYYDPSGAQLAKLLIPGAPTMLLVDKKGSLAQMFFGFDGEWEGLDKAIERLKKAG